MFKEEIENKSPEPHRERHMPVKICFGTEQEQVKWLFILLNFLSINST